MTNTTPREWIYTRPDGAWSLLRRDGRAQTDSTWHYGEVIDVWVESRGALKTGKSYLVLALRTGGHAHREMQTEASAIEAARQVKAHLRGGCNDA